MTSPNPPPPPPSVARAHKKLNVYWNNSFQIYENVCIALLLLFLNHKENVGVKGPPNIVLMLHQRCRHIPVNTTHLTNAGSMLVHRLRRRPSIKTVLVN